jgi:CRISPR-associated protein Csd1
MLQALVDYAASHGLVAEPGFAGRELRWLVEVAADGRCLGVVTLGEGKGGQAFPRCPDLSQPEMMSLPKVLGTERASHFLVETAGVVAGVRALDRDGQPKTDPKSQEESEGNARKHQSFVALMARASEQVPQLVPVAQMLADPTQLAMLRQELETHKAKPTDKLSFGLAGEVLVAGDSWHGWWRGFRRNAFGNEAKESGGDDLADTTQRQLRSLVDGQLVVPQATHLKITKLGVGSMATGASLVGFDKEAFGSFGLEQGENAAMDETSVAAYRASLDALLAQAPVVGQMKLAIWYDLEASQALAADPSLNPLGLLFEPNPEQDKAEALAQARNLYARVRQGGELARLGGQQYFALAMSGAAGRAMVRDWHQGSLADAAHAVATWFADLQMVRVNGDGLAKSPGLMAILMSVQRPKPRETALEDYLRPVRLLQLPLWRAALDPKRPIPYPLLAKLMESHRADVMSGRFRFHKAGDGDEGGMNLARLYCRMGLIRAYHCRRYRHLIPTSTTEGAPDMTEAAAESPTTPTLNPHHPSAAYHCGRLMYLLAQVQEAALGEVNAGLVQRYYGAASTTPALVLGRLTRLSQAHLAKLGRDKGGLAVHLEQNIALVWATLGQGLPKTLNLEEQSLFALGYYQQMAQRYTKADS